MAKKSVVQLRVYRGTHMSYDEQGKAQNENQPVKILYPSFEWDRFLKNLRLNGYCKVEVEKFTEVDVVDGKEVIKDLGVNAELKAEVAEAFAPKEEKVESADQKRIAELERKIEELTNGKPKKAEPKPDVPKAEVKEEVKPSGLDRDALIEEYKALFNKSVFNGWSDEQIAAKIAKKKSKA